MAILEGFTRISSKVSTRHLVKRMTARHRAAWLLVIMALGLFLRLRGLDRVGFNEDEIHKVDAARAYLRGDFSLNREHPMLMKSMIAVSLAATDFWNRDFRRSHPISEEVAVRLPNVLFGTLTAVIIFLFAQELCGTEVALLAAFFWSIGTLAIIVNRLAKEDTLLVFFTWLAFYLYYRAKTLSKTHPELASKWYTAAGASFGLMFASKYFPHYLGILFLYWYLPSVRVAYPPFRRREYFSIFGTFCLVFLLANPVILLPSTLKYMLYYVRQGTVTHHGYLMMGNFYYNDPTHFLHGMPVYFYPLLLVVKTPVAILAGLAVGLFEVYRRRHEPASLFLLFMFLMWLVPFSLVSAKWLRWTLSWMPSVYVIAAVGTAKMLTWTRRLSEANWRPLPTPLLTVLASLLLLVAPVINTAKASPFYSLYLNSFGFGHKGFYFPHDEWADVGLRPSIERICQEAPTGAFIAGEAPPVFAYYLRRFGRTDLHYVDLSSLTENISPLSAWVVIEDGRKYVENIDFVRAVEFSERPTWTIAVGSASAARVYRDPDWSRQGSPPAGTLPSSSTSAQVNPTYPRSRAKVASLIPGPTGFHFDADELAMRTLPTIKIQLEE